MAPMDASENANSTPNAIYTRVPWPTVLYTLLPLATAAMSQPTGSVLLTLPISRTWLRSSPVFCIIDVAAFVIQVLNTSFRGRAPLRDAFLWETESRFKDVGDEAERLGGLRRGFVVRWLFFLIGTHTSFLRLVGAGGLPWTKAIGLCYAVSFAFWEVVIWVYPKLEKKRPALSMILRRSEKPSEVGFWLACCCHGALMLWSVWDLVGIEMRKVPLRQDKEYVKIDGWSWLFSLVCLLAAWGFLLGMRWFKQYFIFTVYWMAGFMCLFLSNLCFLLNERPTDPMRKDEDGKDAYYDLQNRVFGTVFAVSAAVLVHHYLWPFLPLHFPKAAERLLIIEPSTARLIEGGKFRIPIKTEPAWMAWWQIEDRTWLADLPLTMCLANGTLFVLWYWCRYDEVGTGYPTWTEGMS